MEGAACYVLKGYSLCYFPQMDTLNSLDYIASNTRMIKEQLEKMWKEAVMA
jgi:hypothetical protein